MKVKSGVLGLVILTLIALAGCQNKDQWVVQGEVVSGGGDTLFVKHLVNNKHEVVAQKELNKDGKFSLKLEKKEFAEFYFLQVNSGPQLVIVRDSLDKVQVNAQDSTWKQATIVGSELSQTIQKYEQEIKDLRQVYYQYQKADEATSEQMAEQLNEKFNTVKNNIGQEIYKDPSSLFSYYALFQRIDERNLLFSPIDEVDYNLFAAVATSYDVFRKGDPRTKALHDMVLSVLTTRRKARLNEMVANAPEGIPEIVKNDVNGKERKLSDLKGKVVILNFWMSQSTEAKAFNQELKQLYGQYHRRGLEVYQVSSDQSKIIWQDAVEKEKLPWISVCDCSQDIDRHFLTYNVQKVPTTFLIGRDGLMINKFSSANELEAAIKKAL